MGRAGIRLIYILNLSFLFSFPSIAQPRFLFLFLFEFLDSCRNELKQEIHLLHITYFYFLFSLIHLLRSLILAVILLSAQ